MSEIEVKVPNIGDFKDVEVIEVLVSAGQTLKKNDPLTQLIPLKIGMVSDVNNGKLNLNPNGTFWYRANSNEFEKDSFSYRIISDFGKSEEIKVTLENKNFQKLIKMSTIGI